MLTDAEISTAKSLGFDYVSHGQSLSEFTASLLDPMDEDFLVQVMAMRNQLGLAMIRYTWPVFWFRKISSPPIDG